MAKILYRIEIDLDTSFSSFKTPYHWKILALNEMDIIYSLDSGYSKSIPEAFNDAYKKYQYYKEKEE